jgi:hypothetical protein
LLSACVRKIVIVPIGRSSSHIGGEGMPPNVLLVPAVLLTVPPKLVLPNTGTLSEYEYVGRSRHALAAPQANKSGTNQRDLNILRPSPPTRVAQPIRRAT